VIVVVEGPSGAGKTTWCRQHGGRFALLEALPDHASVPADARDAARFWLDRNVARWREVSEREARDGLVVVDTDPFKLHFVWTLFQSGQGTERDWITHREVAREAFAAGRYALADLYLVSDIDADVLRARRDADGTRTRRNFERHVLLRDALIRWYRAVDALEPGRVVFGLPDGGLTARMLAMGKRTSRVGADVFDGLVRELEVG
jgi:hypothetical protein